MFMMERANNVWVFCEIGRQYVFPVDVSFFIFKIFRKILI